MRPLLATIIAGDFGMKTALLIETQILDGDILVIVLDGSLNETTSEHFTQAIQNHLNQGRSKIIIDCRRVEYISSFGLGSLVALQARLRRKGGEAKLAGLYGVAADVIRLVGLDKLLNIYGDIEYARESFYPTTRSTEDSHKRVTLAPLDVRPSQTANVPRLPQVGPE
jgi:anti-anti-sigma factor